MNQTQLRFETRCISSLEKVFPDGELTADVHDTASALRGEYFAFQVAYRPSKGIGPVRVQIRSPLAEVITVRAVGLAPSELTTYALDDPHVLRVTPGLYPDPLHPLDASGAIALPGQWRAVWIAVNLQEETAAGMHEIAVEFETRDGERLAEEHFKLEVLEAVLPPQRLIHTEWFHADCLTVQYGVEAFSDDHWLWIERYVQTAVEHGINMLLTPLFTPPLDTAVGGERPTTQLVDVKVEAPGNYSFSFDRLERWVKLCQACGIQYFEFSHLFTQWGARHAPKIMASVEGRWVRIFGWDTDAGGTEYREFLNQFLPELIGFIKLHSLEESSYFHVSDEPSFDHLESYRSASAIMSEHLADFPVIDALSDIAFYEEGLVKNPVPANNHIEPFLESGIPDLWTYYCSAQAREVSNRFFNMPSSRNRILGWQLYKFGIRGFLHWGYNFWFTQHAKRAIDPYRITDAGHAFPSGDSFLVYPGEEGPVESIRLEVLREALQDLRALECLEGRIGRSRVLELIESDLVEPLTFKEYPMDPEWLLAKRQVVNRMIAEFA